MDNLLIDVKANSVSTPFLINGGPESFHGKFLDLEWRDLNVDIIDSKGEKNKTILKKCTGYVKHGQMMAIMGPSGAGKTTLLNMLAGRIQKTKNVVPSGDLKANNKLCELDDFAKFCGFVLQDDVMHETMTPKELIRFSANLRLDLPQQEKEERIAKVIHILQLDDCCNTYVGGKVVKGISGGERKRTSIGIEMISDPSVLILDEPTSGLDSFTAFLIVKLLRDLAKNENKTVILTIHQPSSDIFKVFDRLILLENGELIYQGLAHNIVDYLESLRIHVPKYANPADFYLDVLMQAKKAEKPIAFNHENYLRMIEPKIEEEILTLSNTPFNLVRKQNSHFFEMQQIFKRGFLNFIRNPMVLRGKILTTLFLAFLFDSIYFRIGYGAEDIHDSLGYRRYSQNMAGSAFFFLINCWMGTYQSVLLTFPVERAVFLREENAKLYRISSYYFGKLCVDLPMYIIFPIFYYVLCHWTVGYDSDADRTLIFMVLAVLASMIAFTCGSMVGSLFKDINTAISVGPFILMPFLIFAGFTSNLNTIPAWFNWLQYFSPFKYMFEAVITNEFRDKEFMINSIVNGTLVRTPVSPLDVFKFDLGISKCIGILFALFAFFGILGLTFLKILVKKVQ